MSKHFLIKVILLTCALVVTTLSLSIHLFCGGFFQVTLHVILCILLLRQLSKCPDPNDEIEAYKSRNKEMMYEAQSMRAEVKKIPVLEQKLEGSLYALGFCKNRLHGIRARTIAHPDVNNPEIVRLATLGIKEAAKYIM